MEQKEGYREENNYQNGLTNFDLSGFLQIQNSMFNNGQPILMGSSRNDNLNGYNISMISNSTSSQVPSQNNQKNNDSNKSSNNNSNRKRRHSDEDDNQQGSPSKKVSNTNESDDSSENNDNNGRLTPEYLGNWYTQPQASSTPYVNGKPGHDISNYMLGGPYYPQVNNLLQNINGYNNPSNFNGGYTYGGYNQNLFGLSQQSFKKEDVSNDSNNTNTSDESSSDKIDDSGVVCDGQGTFEASSSKPDIDGIKIGNSLIATYNPFNPTEIVTSNPLNITPQTIFCTVPGRLSLLSATTKYHVTIAELQRRILAPECLNASILGGILRKAKSKDGGKMLRQSLSQVNLALPAGRRKAAKITAFTSLVEAEAVHLAKDYHYMCDKEFPSKEVGQFIVNNELQTNTGVDKLKQIFEHTRIVINLVCDLLNKDNSPIEGIKKDQLLADCVQNPLTRFSLLTHGFGSLSLLGAFGVLKNIIDEGSKHMDTCLQQSHLNLQQTFGLPIHNQQSQQQQQQFTHSIPMGQMGQMGGMQPNFNGFRM
ncbi:Transcription factor AP-2 [Strongyloides ratti]|uniref:Transcription factor AP-2 n=1 Tax=Strongyloides ratti TaxID=34506 RepID=A0A090LIH1_STRRB|nr:Transcription factor AP-2 [Strongyloides ratti]CEF69612.1 Transcription factor AP-2 [Strongyloides ratti]